MSEQAVTTLPSGEALVFIGLVLQAAAVFWIWRDWQMSQYQLTEWRKVHKTSESATIESLTVLWAKFGGPASVPTVDWNVTDSIQLEDMSKEFPSAVDGDTLRARKIAALTPRFGIGPDDSDLIRIRGHLEHLALLRRGVPDYRTFVRKKTFGTALKLMLAGFVFQLVGSLPVHWTIRVTSPSGTQQPR